MNRTIKFRGKAIKIPKGKAAEYAKYSVNFYVGCSNGCTYCYLRKAPFNTACGGDKPTLAKCFNNEQHALEIFEKELKANLPELQKHGLFFTFTSDPLIKLTAYLTNTSVNICIANKVPVKILTKCTDYIMNWTHGLPGGDAFISEMKKYVSFGFTLTGHDELEPNASTNAERIEAMRKLHEAGFKTWASIEPIIDIKSSMEMILQTMNFCKHYKVGLESGKKYCDTELRWMIHECGKIKESTFYFKDSFLKQANMNRDILPSNCVDRDYNMFND
jgi:DNA repair photolyase